MIISASRRTDIPAFYSDWLLHRIREGYVQVRNPFHAGQVRRISLLPEAVDCFVFWTKDPLHMLDKLEELDRRGYTYYFQFTLTPYSRELERGLRDKDAVADTFIELASRIGRERVRWRYDPVVLNAALDIPWHVHAFERLCERLHASTGGVTISFVDLYAKVRSERIRMITAQEMSELAAAFARIAGRYDLAVEACCEAAELAFAGVGQAACIDRELVERITCRTLRVKRDTGQRAGCGCVQSVDIGAYNTCAHGCVYCYASHSRLSVEKNRHRHNPLGEFLTG